MFRDNLKEQKNFFMWYYSKKKDDYVCQLGVHHWCDMPCDQDHPYYWSNVPFHYLNNIECKKDEEAMGAFGCSITFGTFIKEKETWPYLLSTKIKKKVLNFAGPGLGLDSIYLNLKNSNKEYHFEKVIILLPDFDRRITRFKHNDFWFKWPTLPELSTVWKSLLDPPTHEDLKIDNNDFIKEGEKTIKKILLDKNSNYSKKILTRIMTFCSKNFKKTYISSWSPTVYSYIKKNYSENLLPFYDITGPRTPDLHPTIVQNQRFVDNIMEHLEF